MNCPCDDRSLRSSSCFERYPSRMSSAFPRCVRITPTLLVFRAPCGSLSMAGLMDTSFIKPRNFSLLVSNLFPSFESPPLGEVAFSPLCCHPRFSPKHQFFLLCPFNRRAGLGLCPFPTYPFPPDLFPAVFFRWRISITAAVLAPSVIFCST